MKKLIVIICILGLINCTDATGQYSRMNLVLDCGYSLPLASMRTYYNGGFEFNMKTITSLSKRRSDLRVSVVTNVGYYMFGGKSYFGYDSHGYFTEFRSSSFAVIPIHAGLRVDVGHTKESPIGMYMSQDFGLTYVDGPTGGSRYGHSFVLGCLLGRFDMEMAFHAWKRSNGNNFRYFTLGMGVVIF